MAFISNVVVSVVCIAILVTIIVRRNCKQKHNSARTGIVDDNFYCDDEEDEENYQEIAFTDENDYHDA